MVAASYHNADTDEGFADPAQPSATPIPAYHATGIAVATGRSAAFTFARGFGVQV